MTLMRHPQPLRTTARNPHGLHGHLDGLVDSHRRHDEPRNGHQFDSAGVVVEGFLSGVEREPEIAVAKIFGVGKSRAENVGDDSRFDKQQAHIRSSQAKRTLVGSGRMFATVHEEYRTLPLHHGEHAVNTPNPSTQISRKSAQASSTRSATFGGFGGNPSTPSLEADGAKMDGAPNRQPDRAAKAGITSVNSKQAANQFLETAAWALESLITPAHVAEPLPTHGKLAIVKAFLEQICAGRGRVLQGITGSLRAQSNPVRTQSAATTLLPVGIGRLTARTFERSGPNTVGARALAAIFLRNAGTIARRICNLCRIILAAGKPFIFALVNGSAKPTNGVALALKFPPVPFVAAAAHVVNSSNGVGACPTKEFPKQERMFPRIA